MYVCMYVCMKQWLDFCGNPDLLPDPEIVNTIILTDLRSRTLRDEYSWLLLSTRNAISVDVIFFLLRVGGTRCCFSNSVRLSVRHIVVLYVNESTCRRCLSAIWCGSDPSFFER